MHGNDGASGNPHWQHDVPALLLLDQIGEDRFRNRHNQPNLSRALFGGQIVAQALAAADRTVDPDRHVHSLHSYFHRAGADTGAVDYHVERLRDGRRLSTRRVTAWQDGKAIFSLECSYRIVMDGFSHQRTSGIPFAPEQALAGEALDEAMKGDMPNDFTPFMRSYPVELRLPSAVGFSTIQAEARRHYWLRAMGADSVHDQAGQRQILAFLSDFLLAGVPASRHTAALPGPHLFVTSIDHSIWFHRPLRCDDWLLFETEGPNAQGAVNLALCHVYDRSGNLVATVAQEALQYPLPPPG